ncbi:MAG TPA: hypothetical protein VNL91_05255 [Thermoanaerobaculia bacterium]|nr:hypothetical protein [Thermoanaerobaculia bacterium]
MQAATSAAGERDLNGHARAGEQWLSGALRIAFHIDLNVREASMG